MSYRNDHEAALLRVDALEQEVARLRSAPQPEAQRPAPKRRPYASLLRAGVAMLLAGIGVVAIIGREHPTVEAALPPAVERVVVPESVAALRSCIAAIKPAEGLNETTTDPHGAANSPAPIVKTGASCRNQLASLGELQLDPVVEDKLRRWAVAEDKLADPISMITVYYGADPYALDNYATAPQLWREYRRALATRDAAIAELQPVLANAIATR